MASVLPTSMTDLRDLPAPGALPALRIAYETAAPSELLAQPNVLAVVGFGRATAPLDHTGYVHVGLDVTHGGEFVEVWRGRAHVQYGRDAQVRWSSDGDYTFAALEIEESAHGGVEGAARHAYELLSAWCRAAPDRHVLRIWNYLDAINSGAGDTERYRQFCAGRAAGMNGLFDAGYPAATAIGRRDGKQLLQLYWLAAREPGVPLENPRQMSAWRYPRQYGPKAPNFARAMRSPAAHPQIYISGTAAIVGHTSHHAHDCLAQLDETLANLESLLGGGGHLGPHCVLKVYLRHAADAHAVRTRLRERLGDTPMLLLLGDVCRAELLIEIDGVHSAR
jgi:chorismate lyase / 3-hydroxybenzoate synthase